MCVTGLNLRLGDGVDWALRLALAAIGAGIRVDDIHGLPGTDRVCRADLDTSAAHGALAGDYISHNRIYG